ncbi:MAG: acetylglutamate kinase [Lentisphaeria bacterium]|nr:acetylglutamate kinase [Lentisphaeria bacterium]
MDKLIRKAEVLIEALPYMQKFQGSIVVVKFGGSAMEDPAVTAKTMRDIVLLHAIGIKVVVVHGGGKAISAKLKELGVQSKFFNGLRITDGETIKVVDDVLHNLTNKALVDAIKECDGKGVSISGKSIMRAEKLFSEDPETREKVDIGFVGKVLAVNVNPILDALEYGFIPVITPLAVDFFGQPYNVNADTAACEIAKALKAEKLVFLSDVPGVLKDPADEKTLISQIHIAEVPRLIEEKILSGGMLPKIRSCVEALEAGASKVHMIDGRIPHSLLLEIFTEKGVGTAILKD